MVLWHCHSATLIVVLWHCQSTTHSIRCFLWYSGTATVPPSGTATVPPSGTAAMPCSLRRLRSCGWSCGTDTIPRFLWYNGTVTTPCSLWSYNGTVTCSPTLSVKLWYCRCFTLLHCPSSTHFVVLLHCRSTTLWPCRSTTLSHIADELKIEYTSSI